MAKRGNEGRERASSLRHTYRHISAPGCFSAPLPLQKLLRVIHADEYNATSQHHVIDTPLFLQENGDPRRAEQVRCSDRGNVFAMSFSVWRSAIECNPWTIGTCKFRPGSQFQATWAAVRFQVRLRQGHGDLGSAGVARIHEDGRVASKPLEPPLPGIIQMGIVTNGEPDNCVPALEVRACVNGRGHPGAIRV
jgi:hypothetical protein